MSPSRLPALLPLGLALIAGLSACPKEETDPLGSDVVALVNGEPLTGEMVLKELSTSEVHAPTQPQLAPLKRAVLDSLIERMLLLQEARKLEISVPEDEVERRLLRMAADYPDDQFAGELGRSAMTRADLKRKTRERMRIERLFVTHVYPRVAVTESQLREAYEARAETLKTPEQVRMHQIVVKELDEAERLRRRLRAGESFGDLARRYSLSADAKVGGDLGFFPRGQMPPVFEEWAFKLAVGQTSEVVESEYGFHLFRVVERRSASQPSFAEARVELERQLVHERRQDAERAWVKELEDAATIEIDEALLQSLQPSGPGRPER